MNLKPKAIHTVTWDGDSVFAAQTASGLQTMMQENSRPGFTSSFMNPVDTFISALGGCSGYTIISTCKERGIDVTGIESRIESVRRADPPTVFTSIHVHFTLTGDINEKEVQDIIRDVMTMRCPVAVSFGKLADLTWSHDIVRNT